MTKSQLFNWSKIYWRGELSYSKVDRVLSLQASNCSSITSAINGDMSDFLPENTESEINPEHCQEWLKQ